MRPASIAFALVLLLQSAGCGLGNVDAGLPELARRRHVVLDGAHNFRDLGGYATEDGRTVRWGRFYRSDNLAHLTDADLEKLHGLGIRLVCDFRTAAEKAAEPDRLPAQDPPQVAALEIGDESFAATTLRDRIRSGELGDVDLRQMLIDANRLFATRFADRYAAMFARITKPENLPALVHCTAGKDRAGFASALILRVLGVPMDTVYDDFLLTNAYTAPYTERTLLMIRLVSLFRVDPEQVRPVLGVERAYLEAAFDAIDEKYGDFEHFRREALGLDDAAVAAFREIGLEGGPPLVDASG